MDEETRINRRASSHRSVRHLNGGVKIITYFPAIIQDWPERNTKTVINFQYKSAYKAREHAREYINNCEGQ